MIYLAEIDILPLKELLDPQGKAVENGLAKMGMSAIQEVRIGKHITLKVEASNEDEARKMVDDACHKLLVNKIMEFYKFKLSAVN